MRVLLLTFLAFAAPIASAAPVPGCAADVCVEADSWSGDDCGAFYMEWVRVSSAPAYVSYTRWCAPNLSGIQVSVSLVGGEAASARWADNSGACETTVMHTGASGFEYLSPGCPAGGPPQLPPFVPSLP